MGESVMRVGLVALILCLGLSLGRPARAQGPEHVACTVRVIHALPQGTGVDRAQRSGAPSVDPRLEGLRGQLAKPPLSAWKSFKLLSQKDLDLKRGVAATFEVPGDHQGSVTYHDVVAEGQRQRLRLHLQLRDGAAKLLDLDYKINDGGTIIQGGIKHQDGVLVLGVTCHVPLHP